FVSEIYMNLVGDATVRDHSLPFSFTTTAGETIQVSAYGGAGQITRAGVVDYSGKLPAFTVTGGEVAEASVEDFLFRIHSNFGEKVGEYVIPGNGEFSIKKIVVKESDDLSFTLTDLLMASDMQLNDDR